LIRDLFQLAQIEQNNFVIEREQVVLCELIHQVANRIRPSLHEKQMTLRVHCDNEIICFIDPDRFQQVMTNLLNNAQKHAFAGTEIVINVVEVPHQLIITITDEGEGIPDKDLPYIFDRLYRVEKSRSRQSGGSGLGLAITKEIIESHDGTIEVQSEV